jgi:hypothetical protein
VSINKFLSFFRSIIRKGSPESNEIRARVWKLCYYDLTHEEKCAKLVALEVSNAKLEKRIAELEAQLKKLSSTISRQKSVSSKTLKLSSKYKKQSRQHAHKVDSASILAALDTAVRVGADVRYSFPSAEVLHSRLTTLLGPEVLDSTRYAVTHIFFLLTSYFLIGTPAPLPLYSYPLHITPYPLPLTFYPLLITHYPCPGTPNPLLLNSPPAVVPLFVTHITKVLPCQVQVVRQRCS